MACLNIQPWHESSLKSLNAPEVQIKEIAFTCIRGNISTLQNFSHPPLCCPLVVLMFEKVLLQKHGLHISLKLIARFQGTLESGISLASMACIENLVVGVYSSLYKFQKKDTQQIGTRVQAK